MSAMMPPDGIRGEIRPLTGIRGIAALWVVVLHLSLFTPRLGLASPAAWRAVADLGYLAVDLFFVLSGFVLALTGLRRVGSDVRHEFRPFVLARMFRLYPLHLSVLAAFVLFAVAANLYGSPSYRPGDLALTAALVQIWRPGGLSGWNVPSWSIAAEMVAYLFFPVLAVVALRVRHAAGALALAAAVLGALVLVLALCGSHSLEHIERLGALRCLCEFAAGVMTWRCVDLLGGHRTSGDALLAAGMTLFAGVALDPRAQLVIPVACCALVAACYLPGRLASVLFGNAPVHFLGAISFSVYLDHFLILLAADQLAHTLGIATAPLLLRLAWVAAEVAAIVVVATLTWRYVERPCQDVGRRLRRRLKRSPARSAEPAPAPGPATVAAGR